MAKASDKQSAEAPEQPAPAPAAPPAISGIDLFNTAYVQKNELLPLKWQQPKHGAIVKIASQHGVLYWPNGDVAEFSVADANRIVGLLKTWRPNDRFTIQ